MIMKWVNLKDILQEYVPRGTYKNKESLEEMQKKHSK